MSLALGSVLALAAALRLGYLLALWHSPLFLLNAVSGYVNGNLLISLLASTVTASISAAAGPRA